MMGTTQKEAKSDIERGFETLMEINRELMKRSIDQNIADTEIQKRYKHNLKYLEAVRWNLVRMTNKIL